MTLFPPLSDIEGIRFTDTAAHYGASSPALPLLLIDTPLCNAVISLQGAQLLEFTPAGGTPLLWLSPNASFVPGQAIRGGIPLCAPWFGPHPEDNSKPSHGFVRNRPWQLVKAASMADKQLSLTFEFESDHQSYQLFPYHFTTQLTMSLGHRVELALTVTNRDHRAMPFAWALHSYFPINQIDKARVSGLAGRVYLDNTDHQRRHHLTGDLTFAGQVDRFFPGAGAEQQLNSTPAVCIRGDNCDTVITWNPGQAVAETMSDVGGEHYDKFVCVERGAAFDDAWTIRPGASESARLRLSHLG